MARIIDQAACGGASLPRSASGNSWLLPTSMKLVEQQGQLSPPRVTQALVAAAARITTPDSFTNPRQLIRVDGAPVIIHLLRGLQASGIIRAVITLGHAAQLLAEEVKKHSFGAMVVEFVWCEASSWKRGHASNILAARSMFPKVKAIATPGRPTPPRGCMPRRPPPARPEPRRPSVGRSPLPRARAAIFPTFLEDFRERKFIPASGPNQRAFIDSLTL